MVIRDAQPEADAAACARIYGPFVAGTTVTLEEVPPDRDEMSARMQRVGAQYPWLVAEAGRTVVGFAYASRHRERASYRWAADVSVYVESSRHRRGVGRSLYAELLGRLRGLGYHSAIAGITLPNSPSQALHESFGFRLVGTYRNIGFKLGAWCDVGWWQLELLPPDWPPPEPGRP